MSAGLFDPLRLRQLELGNRIIVSPMCQYSAEYGVAEDWHVMHIGQFAMANPGLIMFEGTAVEAQGRISTYDLGLYNDKQGAGLERVVNFVRQHSNAKLGIQLFHSGRKGSQYRPWDQENKQENGEIIPIEQGGWQGFAPSAIRFDESFPKPLETTLDDLERIKSAFVESARRADRIGLDTIEIHCAHGYLLHTFLSAVSNKRTDAYGGDLENRMRYPLELISAVRDVWPNHKPLGVRLSGTDHGLEDDAWTIEEAAVFAQRLKKHGCDYLDVSSGFLSPNQRIDDYGPGFQAKLAERIKSETGLPTITVGVITNANQADNIIRTGQADAVALGRGMLYDPRWPWHAAQQLGVSPEYPPQYERTFSHGFVDMFSAMNHATGV